MKQPDSFFTYLPPGVAGADAAHEFNNLLTVVLGSLEQLQRQPLDGRGKAQLERAKMALEQANHVLQQLAGPNGWQAKPNDGHPALQPDGG